MKYARFLIYLVLITAALVLWGCAAKQAYEGEKRPLREVALIKDSIGPFDTAAIISIDGEKGMTWTSGEVEALPGYHELEVVLQSGAYTFYSLTKAKISFNAEAGHVYRVEGKIRYGKAWVWVIDENDNSVVAGKEPQRG